MLLASLPVLALALLTFWCGNLYGVGAVPASVASLLLLAIASLGAGRWRQPLGDGAAGRYLPAALLLVVLASWWASPVSRAGASAVLLLPAFLLIPAAVERLWAQAGERRLGLRLLAVLVASVSVKALFGWIRLGDLRPAWPLGHHGLLAGWLILLLPLLLPRLHSGRSERVAVGAVIALGAGTVLAAGSLAGGLALFGQALAAVPRRHRRWGGVVALVLFGFLLWPRLSSIVAGQDSSVSARATYLEGAAAGIRERPGLGWGPGSAAWTLPLHLKPRPGVNPAGEVTASPHSLPVRLGYELGIGGALIAMALGVSLWLRAGRIRRSGADRSLARAARISLLGFAVWSLGGVPLELSALTFSMVLVAGAILAADPRPRRSAGIPGGTVLLLLALGILPIRAGEWMWDRAASEEDPRTTLQRAQLWDPAFPLYRSRGSELAPGGSAEIALAAARDAPGVAALWIRAGELGRQERLPWTRDVLRHACRLNPLGPFAPYLLAISDPDHPEAARSAARALAAEPRLAAATSWDGEPELLRRAIRELESWPGIDLGWREEMVKRLRSSPETTGEPLLLRLTEDGHRTSSSSLYSFRRRPWPAVLVEVEVHSARVAHYDLVAAMALDTTGVEALDLGCR